ncbi:hypothetical protein GC167_03530 [bacterium]|nr:hypothetical protein [bacterium]
MPTDPTSHPISIQERRLLVEAQFDRLRAQFRDPGQRSALVSGLRALYAEVLLLDFLEREAEARLEMEHAIRARMMQALESSVSETAVPTSTPETVPPSAPAAETTLRPEIVVVPVPQGPPVVRREEPQPEAPRPEIAASTASTHAKEAEKPERPHHTPRPPASWELGLNDRIAFTQQLFGGQAEDYHRALSQLGTLASAAEARKFVNEQLRPDYNWTSLEAQEQLERLFELIEARFGG